MPLYTTLQHLLNVLVQIANKTGFYQETVLYVIELQMGFQPVAVVLQ
jgi:hypothetical protein